MNKCKAALVNGKPIPDTNSRHRFSFYCDEWLRMRKPKVKESTYIKYDTALRKHIEPKLGGCFPIAMTTGLMDDFTEELLFEDELAPKTVHDVLVVLHGILKYTATFFTGGFPAIEINYPKPAKKEMRTLSREERTRFVSYLLDDMDACKFGVLLTLFMGIRIGELCALQWGNTITFTDMEGIFNTYCVEKIETLTPNEVDAVQNNNYDLVLYTCTKDGQTRVTVFCNRIKSRAL